MTAFQRNYPDGSTGQADRYMGECPCGDGRINYGDGWISRQGQIWHAGCDPDPDPCCWCGELLQRRPGYIGEHEHAACWAIRRSIMLMLGGLREHFRPAPPPKFRQTTGTLHHAPPAWMEERRALKQLAKERER
jgi:hypothetical protein